MTRHLNHRTRKGPRQKWRTGRGLAALIVERWGVDLDVAAEPCNAIVPHFIGPPGVTFPESDDYVCVGSDALVTPWELLGTVAFCNGPFALLLPMTRAAVRAKNEGMRTIILGPDNGDPEWALLAADEGATFYRFRGRPKYEPHDGSLNDSSGPGFPSTLMVFEPNAPRRVQGTAVPTFWLDPTSLAVL